MWTPIGLGQGQLFQKRGPFWTLVQPATSFIFKVSFFKWAVSYYDDFMPELLWLITKLQWRSGVITLCWWAAVKQNNGSIMIDSWALPAMEQYCFLPHLAANYIADHQSRFHQGSSGWAVHVQTLQNELFYMLLISIFLLWVLSFVHFDYDRTRRKHQLLMVSPVYYPLFSFLFIMLRFLFSSCIFFY